MGERKVVTFCRCGTEEQWIKNRDRYGSMHHVVPGTIYVSEEGLCLVTSQEWVEWLMGRSEHLPDIDN